MLLLESTMLYLYLLIFHSQAGEETETDTASDIHTLEESSEFCTNIQSTDAANEAGGNVTEVIPFLHCSIRRWIRSLGQVQQSQRAGEHSKIKFTCS